MATQNSGSSVDRKSLWLAIAGGLGIVIGIVALIIAISAKNATSSDAKVTAAVNQAARLAVAGLHNQLQHDVASATTVLKQLEASGAAAAREHKVLLGDINRTKAGVAVNSGGLAKAQADIATLNSEVQKLTANQQALTKKVDAIATSTTTTTTTTTSP